MAPLTPRAMMPSLRTMLAILAALAGAVITLQLGYWQMRRAAEKIASEQTWVAAQRAAPIEVRGATEVSAVAAHLPRRVHLRGYFQNEHTIWLDNRALEGRAGFLVITPMRLQDTRDLILVNRGWAPRDPAERTRLPSIGRPAGLVDVEGMALAGVPRVFQFGKADLGSIRQNLDIDGVRAEMGAPLAQFVVQQTSSIDDTLDRRWPPPATGVDRHRGYAFQWFSLAALLGVIVVGLAWRAIWRRSAARGTA